MAVKKILIKLLIVLSRYSAHGAEMLMAVIGFYCLSLWDTALKYGKR